MSKLLVQLRRLRQRVELAVVHTARNEVVARPFRRRLRQDRRLDLEEAARVEKGARRLHQPVAQHEVRLERCAAQIEITIPQPRLLSRKVCSLCAHRDRDRLGAPNDRDRGGLHLDLTGRHVGIHRSGRPEARRRPRPSPRFRAVRRRPRRSPSSRCNPG